MGKKQFIDRKNARHFHLVHRSQRDPLSRDESAPQRVLKEVVPANLVGKVKPLQDDEDPFADDQDLFSDDDGDYADDGINYGTYNRAIEEVELLEAPQKPTAGAKKKSTGKNEEKIGEAALMGLVGDEFNDGSYDYSQHMKEMGKASDAVYLTAPKTAAQQRKAARGIQFTDADAADEMAAEDQPATSKASKKKGIRLPSEVLPSKEELDFEDVYQSAVPVGLQPDMPFDIRQTLEALEDDEFVDGELDDSFFDQLDGDGGDFDEDEYYEDEEEEEEESAGGWEADFKKFKKAQKYASDDGSDDGSDTGYSQTSKSSRRPGGASASTFSMSSSAMFRNENLTLLDERFDKIEREYEDDSLDEDEEEPRDLAAEELRKDFDSILDDFLEKYEIVGSKMVPRLEGATSENKLSTIRNALLVDDDEDGRSVATTTGGTRRPKKNLDEDVVTEETDFRSRAERMRDNWDVQTILSTYSNLENRPGMIREQHQRRIQIDPKTGMPVVTEKLSKKALQRRKEAEEAEAAANGEQDSDNEDEEEGSEEEVEAENLGAKRNKGESKEEKKARKDAIKQEKRDRREVKKATKAAFATEKTRQEKVMKNQKKGQGVMHLD
ncbi:hypothetical protein B0O80DRAFT_502601 [Mortierella sp. GBAus27b]|nr:hypothetical protein B0O80DRAFT_502601 [Mortierella sp. GBAus27b]